MDTLKKGLAFPMYGTAAWLVWVFNQQAGSIALGELLAAAVLVAFAGWLWGHAQTLRSKGRPSLVSLVLALLALVGAIALTALTAGATPPAAAGPASADPLRPASGPGLRALVAGKGRRPAGRGPTDPGRLHRRLVRDLPGQ
jgi:thiol:disulfide interchange protein